jgi:hypothetical protein
MRLQVRHHKGNLYMKRYRLGMYHLLQNNLQQYHMYNSCQHSMRRMGHRHRRERACQLLERLFQMDLTSYLNYLNYYRPKIDKANDHNNHSNRLDNTKNHNKVDQQLYDFRQKVVNQMNREQFDLRPS